MFSIDPGVRGPPATFSIPRQSRAPTITVFDALSGRVIRQRGEVRFAMPHGLTVDDRGPGQFDLPHDVFVHRSRVYVCDRSNERVQIFDLQGKYLETVDQPPLVDQGRSRACCRENTR